MVSRRGRGILITLVIWRGRAVSKECSSRILCGPGRKQTPGAPDGPHPGLGAMSNIRELSTAFDRTVEGGRPYTVCAEPRPFPPGLCLRFGRSHLAPTKFTFLPAPSCARGSGDRRPLPGGRLR